MKDVDTWQKQAILRTRAVARLTGPSTTPRIRGDAAAALGVLYELASSPATAPGALALLHELQVHQVELDLQDEELRRARLELESALQRHSQLYDSAPTGYFTLQRDMAISELNLTGAGLLGYDREYLKGRALDTFLVPDSARELHRSLESVAGDGVLPLPDLQLRGRDGPGRRVHGSACRDPAGDGFLIALMDAGMPVASQ